MKKTPSAPESHSTRTLLLFFFGGGCAYPYLSWV